MAVILIYEKGICLFQIYLIYFNTNINYKVKSFMKRRSDFLKNFVELEFHSFLTLSNLLLNLG